MAFLLVLIVSVFSFADCVAPDGSPMSIGDSMVLFKTEYVPESGSCESALVECEIGGTLSAKVDDQDPTRSIASLNPEEYKYLSCLDEKTCENPFGPERLTHGMSVVAYQKPEPPCLQQTRICDGATGELSGSFIHNVCFEKNYVETQ